MNAHLIFMDFKNYKFNANVIGHLVSDVKNSHFATPKQMEKALLSLDKEDLLGLTATDIENLLVVIEKHLKFSPSRVPVGGKRYLAELYGKLLYGVSDIEPLEDISNRRFQISGTKCEQLAIEMISNEDKFEYEKNKTYFENDYFTGKPDVLSGGELKEVKTVQNLSKFMLYDVNKAPKLYQFQIQCYMDLLDYDSCELIFVLTGMHHEDRDEYLAMAEERYTKSGLTVPEVSKRLKKLEKNVTIDHIPTNNRIARATYKRNPYMIRLAKKKVTAARNFLTKLDLKFNGVVLP